MDVEGAVRGKRKTHRDLARGVEARLADLLERTFTVPAPNRLCTADLTCVSTSSGFVYVAFVIDAYSRAIVGWRISNPLPLPEDFGSNALRRPRSAVQDGRFWTLVD